jgi:hypothetical protein
VDPVESPDRETEDPSTEDAGASADDDRRDRDDARQAAKQARTEAKDAARRERQEAKEAARREREREKAVDAQAADDDVDDVDEAQVAARASKDAAREAARREREEAKEAARREREESKAAARSAKADRRAEKKAEKEADRIVEAPREPKVSLLDRWRRTGAAGEPGDRSGARNVVAVLAVAIGVLGLVCSLILAVGAFMAALGTTDSNGAYDTLSSICDVLVGPLRDVFSFSGANAEMKEAVVSWGAGSMIYVLVGMFAQSYLRSRADDD